MTRRNFLGSKHEGFYRFLKDKQSQSPRHLRVCNLFAATKPQQQIKITENPGRGPLSPYTLGGPNPVPTASKPYGLHFTPKHVIYTTAWVKLLFHCPQVPNSMVSLRRKAGTAAVDPLFIFSVVLNHLTKS